MAPHSNNSVFRYLRAFSYLLVIYGVVLVAVGAAVLYAALTSGGTDEVALSLPSAVLGFADAAVGCLTVAVGVVACIASKQPARLSSLHTLSIAGIVGTVLGAALCSGVGNTLPTSLLFNAVLMVLALAIALNLQKQQA